MRITHKKCEALAEIINSYTNSPLNAYEKEGDRYVAQVGNYHIDRAYGGCSLVRMVNESGGVTTVLDRGPAGDLFARMHAWLAGFLVGRGEA